MPGIMPLAMLPTCMLPPLPLQQPVAAPNSSLSSSCIVRPLARAWPWPRKVEVMKSSCRSAAHTPTAVASCPWHWWIVPGMMPSRKRNLTPSSNCRMSTIRSYSPSRKSRRRTRSCDRPDRLGSSVVLRHVWSPFTLLHRLQFLDNRRQEVAGVSAAGDAVIHAQRERATVLDADLARRRAPRAPA